MNVFKKHILLLAAAFVALSAAAQDSSSSSTLVRRGGSSAAEMRRQPGSANRAGAGAAAQAAQPGVSQRLQSHYEDGNVSDADMMWMRVIYRQLDLTDAKNASLYYPEDLIDGQENLFRIILRTVVDGQVPAYEYLDGREIFTDQYRLNVKDMLDRFYIAYTPGKGSTEKNPKFEIEESDVPTTEVLSYYVLERWAFDSRSNRMKTTVEAICPVLHRAGEWGGESVKYPMFWVKMDNLRPYLAQQYIFVDDDNNLAKYTYDDFFAMNMYEGDIYKTRNLMNKSMAQLYPDPEEMKRAQDSIQNRLDTFDKNLWVPSREELRAAREAREAAESGDSTVVKSNDNKEKKEARPARSTRGEKEKAPKVRKPKEPKQSNPSNSNAVRSVRRRK